MFQVQQWSVIQSPLFLKDETSNPEEVAHITHSLSSTEKVQSDTRDGGRQASLPDLKRPH